MKVLLTAFDPFGGETINPAQEAVRLVPETIGEAQIIKLEVPTVFGKSIETMLCKAREVHPDVILCIGQAGGRYDISPERVAININDARIPDNEGNQPIDEPIFSDGAPAYFSNLPIKAMVQAIRSCGLPASVSNSAGTYVCNHLMYGVLYHIAREMPSVRGGFMHVPYVPRQVAQRAVPAPCLSESDIARGITAAISAILENFADVKTPTGKEH